MRDGLPTLDTALYNIAMSSHSFADFLERLQADGRLVRRDSGRAEAIVAIVALFLLVWMFRSATAQ